MTIGLLAWQTRAAAKQAEVANAFAGATVLHNQTTSLREVYRVFIDHPELRPYFYGRKPCPRNQRQRDRVMTIAEMLADTLEDGLVAHHLVPASESESDWINYCRHVRANSPALEEWVQRHPGWWPKLSAL
ncbi:hypothetical protein [Micromonospora violae]|uniref:hypothetical protein n=1 Tax=Micromonospora violae TaxID=1278207 RepID=UPI0033EE4EC9